MTHDEVFAKNLDLSFEFDRYLIAHPQFAEKIPLNALVVLQPKYDLELSEYNLNSAEKNREPGQPIVYVKIDGLRPEKSRLLRPQIEVSQNGRNGKNSKLRKQKRRLYSKAI